MIKNFSLLGFRMPGEWEKQDSIWITWPYNKKIGQAYLKISPSPYQK